MPVRTFRAALTVGIVAAILCVEIRAEEDSAAQRVGAALEKMHAWVGSGKNGDGWKAHLDSAGLQAELAKGESADREHVAEILKKYESKTPGIEGRRFAEVRTALAAWLTDLKENIPADKLPDFAREQKSAYTAVDADNVKQAKARLATAVQKLGKFLRPGKSTDGWKQYLDWKTLEAQATTDAAPDVKSLVKIYHQFTANHPGLERREFADAGDALLQYIDANAVANLTDAQEQYNQQIEALAESLEKYRQSPSEEEHANIGRRLGELRIGRQAPGLVKAVQRRYSQPNLWAEVSADVVGRAMNRQVSRTVPVNDVILGSSISGNGQLTGDVQVRLVPDKSQAQLEMLFRGSIATNTVGQQRSVTFFSRGNTDFTASKRIFIRPTGVFADGTLASATTNNHVHDVSAGKIATKIAWKRIDESRGQANRIAGDRAAEKIRKNFDKEAAPMLAKAQERFLSRFRSPLLRVREFPELLEFRSTPEAIKITGLQAGRFAIGAPNDPPPMGARHDLTLRVHQSMPANFAAALLGGRTLTDEEIKQQVIALRGSLPEGFEDTEDNEPWTITFARQRPVSVLFDDGGYTITIRLARYTTGEGERKREFRAMNVTAVYKIEPTGDGMRMVRQGELRIAPPDFEVKERRLSAQEITLRTILERKFGKLFREEIVSTGLELPGEWKKAGKLSPAELLSKDGWLAIGWNRNEDATNTAKVGTKAATK